MKYIYPLLVLLLLSACHSLSSQQYEVPDYEKMADRITAITARKIQTETGLSLCGVGGGAIGCIRKLNMSFNCYNEVSIEQARGLVVYCVNEYLSAINSNEEIRQYLVHYPFTPADVEIDVFFPTNNHGNRPTGTIAVVTEVRGQLVYRINQPHPIVLKKVHEETYEEAVRLVEAEGPINKIRRNPKKRSSV